MGGSEKQRVLILRRQTRSDGGAPSSRTPPVTAGHTWVPISLPLKWVMGGGGTHTLSLPPHPGDVSRIKELLCEAFLRAFHNASSQKR